MAFRKTASATWVLVLFLLLNAITVHAAHPPGWYRVWSEDAPEKLVVLVTAVTTRPITVDDIPRLAVRATVRVEQVTESATGVALGDTLTVSFQTDDPARDGPPATGPSPVKRPVEGERYQARLIAAPDGRYLPAAGAASLIKKAQPEAEAEPRPSWMPRLGRVSRRGAPPAIEANVFFRITKTVNMPVKQMRVLLQANREAVASCHEDVFSKLRPAYGQLQLHLVVDETGRLTELRPLRADMHVPELMACVGDLAKGWDFDTHGNALTTFDILWSVIDKPMWKHPEDLSPWAPTPPAGKP